MAGSATFTEEPMNGVRKEERVEARKTERLTPASAWLV
jgi:hypothetical protein